MKEKICGIYKIENKINGKVYIGQSFDMERRWKRHVNELNKSKHCNTVLQRSWDKYGQDNFVFICLETLDESLDLLNEREIYWIQQYNSYIHSQDSKGYNLTIGGDGIKGYLFNDEELIKIKERARQTRNTARKVWCDGMVFDALVDCIKYYGFEDIKEKDVYRMIGGELFMDIRFYKMGLRYLDSDFKGRITNPNGSNNKKVVFNGKVYKSIKIASEMLKLGYTQLSSWLNGYYKIPSDFEGIHILQINEDISNYEFIGF